MATETRTSAGEQTGQGRLIRLAFAVLAALFALSVTVQIFIAGLAIFARPAHWELHKQFVHYFQALPLVMLAVSFFGGLPARVRWQSAALLGLIYVMYFTANFRAIAPYVAAAHPVVAMGVLALAWSVLREAWQAI